MQAAELTEVRDTSEAPADVRGQRPHVRAAAALDQDGRSGIRTGLEGFDVDSVDADAPGRALDLLAAPGQLVEPPAADLHGRHHRRELLDLAEECRDHRLDLRLVDRHRSPVDHLSRRVEGRGRDAEHDGAPVSLAGVLEEAQQPRRASEPHEEHARRVGIERPGVPDAPLVVDLADLRHDVVRGPAGGLVDDDHAVRGHERPVSAQ